MQLNRLCGVAGFLRRADCIFLLPSLYCFRTSWYGAKRRCSVMSDDKVQLVSSGVTVAASTVAVTTENLGWDDNSVIEDIGGVLHSLLLEKHGRKKAKWLNADSDDEINLAVHLLFHALGPPLRVQLQNSSFGALKRALESKPEWFVLCCNGTKVGLTDVAWSRYDGDCKSTATLKGRLDQRLSASRKGTISPSNKTVLIRGAFATTPLDVSKPPLTREEVKKWRLNRLIFSLSLQFLLDKEPVTLFPHGPNPRPLSPELAEIEAVYRAKGFFPPSEVAAAFVHITPTFFVETRHVINAMSPDVAQCFERCISKDRVVDMFFKKYPMIFKLKTGKFQKAVVKLNADFKFISSYPGFGKADRPLRQFNQEYRATVGGVVSRSLSSSSSLPQADVGSREQHTRMNIDLKIFDILIQNLPRVPTDPALTKEKLMEKRCRPFPLVGWIDSFSKEDIDTLNSVPQQRVLTLLTRYVRIFQMVCHGEDANVFTDHKNLEIMKGKSIGKIGVHQEGKGNGLCGTSLSTSNATGEVLENDTHAEFASPKENAEALEEEKLDPPSADSKQREAALAGALRDDLIGLDDILSDRIETSATPVAAAYQVKDDLDAGLEVDGEEIVAAEGVDEESKIDFHDVDVECGRDVDGKDPPTPEHTLTDEESSGPYIPSRYDIIYLRRLPKHIAPRSLSNFNCANSPEPELLRHLLSFLSPPPSTRDAERENTQFGVLSSVFPFSGKLAAGPWRWVQIQRVYASLSKEQKRLLRPYKGLVHFMRLHGEIFELSADFMNFIAHDPEGQIPPFVPTQTVFRSEERVLLSPTMDDDENSKAALIGDAERSKFRGILGASQIPTDRQQLLLLDPLNPVLDHEILCEEISMLMPDHPVSIQQLISRLPPILKAALSVRHRNNFKTSKHLTVWMENNRMMLQKSKLASVESTMVSEETITVEDAIECVREVIPDEGVMFCHMHRILPAAAKRTLKEHFGNVYNALLGYPQYFYIEKDETDRYKSVLFLVERLQEKH